MMQTEMMFYFQELEEEKQNSDHDHLFLLKITNTSDFIKATLNRFCHCFLNGLSGKHLQDSAKGYYFFMMILMILHPKMHFMGVILSIF
jgi:hypothetical protein